jgi:hypothetical protein
MSSMQISKSLLVVCAAVCVIPLLSGRGADNAAQAKAREALEKKLKELDGPAAEPQAEQPKVVPPSADATPSPAANANPGSDPETIAKAREAMRQKMRELQSGQPEVAAKAVRTTRPGAAPQAVPVAQPEDQLVPGAPHPTDPETIAKAREALHQKLRQLQVQESAEAQAQAEVELGPKADPETIAKARAAMLQKLNELAAAEALQTRTGQRASRIKMAGQLEDKRVKKIAFGNFPPIEAPAMPISAEKQQRLAVLLQKYRVDEITPEQYQSQRAQILAEP